MLNHLKKNLEKGEIIYILPFKEDIEKILIGAWYSGVSLPKYKIWDIHDLQKMLESFYSQSLDKSKITNAFQKLNNFSNKYYSLNLASGNRELVQKLYDEYQNSRANVKWRNFEAFVTKFIEFYFNGYIGEIVTQKVVDGGLHRFDAVAPISIKNINSHFLDIVKNCFNCRYLVFEAKSYSQKISQSEIWRTSKYLHKSALRNVAIIITNSKCDKHCKIIQYGLLREQGKLIIVLEGNDIENIMGEPDNIIEDILKQKIDDLMMSMIA